MFSKLKCLRIAYVTFELSYKNSCPFVAEMVKGLLLFIIPHPPVSEAEDRVKQGLPIPPGTGGTVLISRFPGEG